MNPQQQQFKTYINQFHDSFNGYNFADENLYSGFTTIKPIRDVQECIQLFSAFYNSDVDENTYSQLYMIAQNFYTALRTVLQEKNNLRNEGSLRTIFSQVKDQLKAYFNQYKDKIATSNYTAISDPNLVNSKISGLENTLNSLRTQINKLNETKPEALIDQLNSHQSLLQKVNEDTTAFETRYKNVMPQMQALENLSFYTEGAERNKRESFLWLGAGLLSILVCGLITYFLYNHLVSFDYSFTNEAVITCKECVLRNMTYKFIALLGIRIFGISICIYVTTICIRNYRSVMHNRTTNLHKANAFSALLALEKNLASENSKELVNLGIYAIFKETVTGYEPDGNKTVDDIAFKQLIHKLIPGESK